MQTVFRILRAVKRILAIFFYQEITPSMVSSIHIDFEYFRLYIDLSISTGI